MKTNICFLFPFAANKWDVFCLWNSGNMETWTWRHGGGDIDMETWRWRHGDGVMEIEAWKHRGIKTWRNGDMETWRYEDMERWRYQMENGSLGVFS
jgi:hypothetical protein